MSECNLKINSRIYVPTYVLPDFSFSFEYFRNAFYSCFLIILTRIFPIFSTITNICAQVYAHHDVMDTFLKCK